MASTIANIAAEKNPVVLKLSIRRSTSKTISTVMMNDIRPSVRKLIGKVRIRNMVPMVAFARAISIPARIALKKPSTCTPGIRNAAKETAIPINRISIISFIFYKIKVIGLILICFINIAITACQSSTKKTDDFEAIKFELNTDSSKIVLKGLENEIIESLKADTLKINDWQNLFAVYEGTFPDEEKLSEPISGSYTISADNHIIFSPDSSFTKGHVYFVRFYYPQYYSTGNVLKYKTLPGKVAVIDQHFKF